jgi:UDP-N-acetylmuramate dehydrogenase
MEIKEGVLLKDYSTFKIGGPAKYFVKIENLNDLNESILWAREKGEKFMILGGGSNVLFSDKGFNGLVVRLNNKKIELKDKANIYCQAGVALSQLVNFATENGLTGLEWAAGIPGTVGGAIRGNAGAFGFEMKDVVVKTKYFNLKNLKKEECDKDACRFDYRQSVFKEFDSKIIWEAVFGLKKGEKEEIKKEVTEILNKRREKQPCLSGAGSAGSIFKNPIVDEEIIKLFEKEKGVKCRGDQVPAGWLIDMCDMKGYQLGDIQVSDKQANFILNKGNGNAETVIILISMLKQKVRNTFGIQLKEEVEIVDY